MTEEEKKVEETETEETETEETETETEEKKVEDTKESSLKETIAKIKIDYEEKIKKLTEEKDNEIKERDEVIAQLLLGEETATETNSIVDEINAKRTYPKW